jgi:uncharacterized glyoxalase superfamily protein PhnB
MNEQDFYPMPLFVKLAVHDVAASADWYEKALGFRPVYALAGAGGTQVISHIRLGRFQDLMLIAEPPDSTRLNKGQGVIINLAYDGDIDDLAQQARCVGAGVEGPTETPWNTREVSVQDPDGYVLTFSQVVDANREFDDVMSGLR